MRILLVSPHRPIGKHESFLNPEGKSISQDEHYSGAGIGLLIIAALTPKDVEIDFVDEAHERINFETNYDLVAISAMTTQAIRAYEIAVSFRVKGVKTIIGGIHASLLPDEAQQYCDAVAVGEAEEFWPQVIEDVRKNQLKARYKAEKPTDLALSPLPRYDLLKDRGSSKYWVNTTRGCPFKCSFCCSSLVFGSRYRHKPIDKVMEEIALINETHGKSGQKLICFSDDNMFVDRQRAREIVRRITPMKIKWFAQTDVSIAEDEELLAMLRDSGCALLFIGIESVNKDSMEDLGNRVKLRYIDKYPQAIEKIQSYRIGVMGAFIVGLDHDDATCFDKISSFIIDNHIMQSQISILTPLPGTPLRAQLEREKRLLPSDWSHYAMTEVNFIPKNMTVDELNHGMMKIYATIYTDKVIAENKKYFLVNSLKYAALRKSS